MLKLLWNYLNGYVIVAVKGITVERFLNMATYKNILIWDIHYKNGETFMKVGVKDFKKLKSISKKTNCKCKIAKKYGAPFFIYRYRKRKILFFGIPFFVAFLYFLTSFIWAVDIIGYNKIEYQKLQEELYNNGLSIGTFKHTINKRLVEDEMLNSFNDISFININVIGTRAIVTIAENIPEIEILDRTTPTNLIASKGAIIQSVFVASGEPKVVPGDVVIDGDILISGILQDENIEGATYLIHASGEINAHVYYKLNFIVPRSYTVRQYTGRTRNTFEISLLGYNINFPNIRRNFNNYDTITSRAMLNFGYDYPLPFILITHNNIEYNPQNNFRDAYEIEKLAHIKINEAITNNFPIEVDIVNVQKVLETVDQGLLVTAIITTLENIAIEEPLIIYQDNESLIHDGE